VKNSCLQEFNFQRTNPQKLNSKGQVFLLSSKEMEKLILLFKMKFSDLNLLERRLKNSKSKQIFKFPILERNLKKKTPIISIPEKFRETNKFQPFGKQTQTEEYFKNLLFFFLISNFVQWK
jgi:hypothetical protein